MIAIWTIVDRISDWINAEGDKAAPHPTPTTDQAHTAQPLNLWSLVFDSSLATVLTHWTVDRLRFVIVFQVLQVMEVLLRLDKLRCHHDHLDWLVLLCLHSRSWSNLVGLAGHWTCVLSLLLGKAIGGLLSVHIDLFLFHYNFFIYSIMFSKILVYN